MSMRLHSAVITALWLVAAGCSSSTTSTPSGTSGSTSGGDPIDAGTSDGATTEDAPSSTSGTTVTGKLGALGAAKATVSSLWISNSGETLIYLSSAAVTCDQLKTSRWLSMVTAGAQVVEIVHSGAPKVGMLAVPPAEVNYAAGGKSSSYEVGATGGSVTFTKAEANGVVEGTFTASYDSGDMLTGTFHATYCAGGQGY